MSTTRRNYNCCYPIFQINYRGVITNFLSGKLKERKSSLSWPMGFEDLLEILGKTLVLPVSLSYLCLRSWTTRPEHEKEECKCVDSFSFWPSGKNEMKLSFCAILLAGMKNRDWILKFACYVAVALPISNPNYFFVKKVIDHQIVVMFF